MFGSLGFADQLDLFNTRAPRSPGCPPTGSSARCHFVGLILIGGAVIGGNIVSTVNTTVGTLFLLSGFAHIFILDRPANVLGFGMSNVIFCFVMGLLILTFGVYGRVTGGLPARQPVLARAPSGRRECEDPRRYHQRRALRYCRSAAPGKGHHPVIRPACGSPVPRPP